MADLKKFLRELSYAIPGQPTAERRGALAAFEGDLAKDFNPELLTPELARVAGGKLKGVPQYPVLRTVIVDILGDAQSMAAVMGPQGEAGTWLNALRKTFAKAGSDAERRRFAAWWLAHAPKDAIEPAREEHADLMPAPRDEVGEDLRWWWDRVERVQANPCLGARLADAQGMLAVLGRQGAVRRPQIVDALKAIVAGLEQDGVEPATTVMVGAPRGSVRPQKVHEAAPPPKGPEASAKGDGPSLAWTQRPIQYAAQLMATIKSVDDPAKTAEQRLRLAQVAKHFPGRAAQNELIRRIALGEFNGPDGQVDRRRVQLVEDTWADQKRLLAPWLPKEG